jgi:hypothetical protein
VVSASASDNLTEISFYTDVLPALENNVGERFREREIYFFLLVIRKSSQRSNVLNRTGADSWSSIICILHDVNYAERNSSLWAKALSQCSIINKRQEASVLCENVYLLREQHSFGEARRRSSLSGQRLGVSELHKPTSRLKEPFLCSRSTPFPDLIAFLFFVPHTLSLKAIIFQCHARFGYILIKYQ